MFPGLSEPAKGIGERLTEERFNIIAESDKAFILVFSREISELGYDYGGNIGWGACWGRYMVIYSKIEKCSGVVFEFHQPDMTKLPDYMGLLREFYGRTAK